MNNNIGAAQFSPPTANTPVQNDQKQATSNQQLTTSQPTLTNLINMDGVGELILSYAPSAANELRRMSDMRIPGNIGLTRPSLIPGATTFAELERANNDSRPNELQPPPTLEPSSTIGGSNNHRLEGLQCRPLEMTDTLSIILDYVPDTIDEFRRSDSMNIPGPWIAAWECRKSNITTEANLLRFINYVGDRPGFMDNGFRAQIASRLPPIHANPADQNRRIDDQIQLLKAYQGELRDNSDIDYRIGGARTYLLNSLQHASLQQTIRDQSDGIPVMPTLMRTVRHLTPSPWREYSLTSEQDLNRLLNDVKDTKANRPDDHDDLFDLS